MIFLLFTVCTHERKESSKLVHVGDLKLELLVVEVGVESVKPGDVSSSEKGPCKTVGKHHGNCTLDFREGRPVIAGPIRAPFLLA